MPLAVGAVGRVTGVRPEDGTPRDGADHRCAQHERDDRAQEVSARDGCHRCSLARAYATERPRAADQRKRSADGGIRAEPVIVASPGGSWAPRTRTSGSRLVLPEASSAADAI